MKNVLPIILGACIIGAALFIVVRSNKKETASTAPGQTVSQVTAMPTESAGTGTSSSQPLASGITLTVSTPLNNATISTPAITVRGKTIPNAEVFVNDSDTKADANGNFTATLTLDEGENYILVVANDDIGNYSEKELYVTYSP